MPVEDRYFRGDQQTVNGLTAYVLDTTQSDIARNISAINDTQLAGVTASVRVWVRHEDGSEDELTDGTWTQIAVTRTSADSGLQSTTWDCPQTSLAETDAIHIQVKISVSGGTSTIEDFITEQLGATQLDATTWTFYLWTEKVDKRIPPSTAGYFRWGTSTYNSRIEGFSYSLPLEYTLTIDVDKESGYIGETFTFTGNLTLNGSPVEGVIVKLLKNSVEVGSDVTASDGTYEISWIADEVGTYKFHSEASV